MNLNEPSLCNQCHTPMYIVVGGEGKPVGACAKEGCPNFGLLQLGVEEMARAIEENELIMNINGIKM